ncbi:hypothetical protein TUBRATIS_003820 [Tubulinosema ratisbonensis]|uniref:Uncharacterized protein n=1 Tax=Tubulinosema ratisbonensis TaxID=291195 RepID=A0A437APH5_9MICR|nr:hypothetical protein TUBRATIS_003820 [Tubulinosema ratisbonensis]
MIDFVNRIIAFILHFQAINSSPFYIYYSPNSFEYMGFPNQPTMQNYYPINTQINSHPQYFMFNTYPRPIYLETYHVPTQLHPSSSLYHNNYYINRQIPVLGQFNVANVPTYHVNNISSTPQGYPLSTTENYFNFQQDVNLQRSPPNDSKTNFYQFLVYYHRTKEFVNINAVHEIDEDSKRYNIICRKYNKDYNQEFTTRLKEIIIGGMYVYHQHEKMLESVHLADLIFYCFDYDYKNTSLFIIYMSFARRGFSNYYPRGGPNCIDHIFYEYNANQSSSNKSLLKSIETWKTFNLEFQTIKEAYDILVLLGTFYLFNDNLHGANEFVYSYKKYVLDSLILLFNN